MSRLLDPAGLTPPHARCETMKAMEQWEIEEKMRHAGQLGGAAALDPTTRDRPVRDSLQNRVGARINRLLRDGREAERLKELQSLLEKNPDLARILDLLDGIQLP